MTRLLISALVCTGCFLFLFGATMVDPLLDLSSGCCIIRTFCSNWPGQRNCSFCVLGLFGGMAWMEDLYTRYFSAYWLLPFGLLLFWSVGLTHPGLRGFSLLDGLGFVYGIGGLVLWRQKKLGLADVLLLFGLAFGLGFERMQVCMAISLLTGFVLLGFSNEDIPFGSALMIGFVIAFAHGMTLYEKLAGCL
ncbi:hypothetical protein [Allobaculum sp. Allo2]|uniref:hypothetical protein n=1 Tax=Allobaculum sp. Allo2 TaxID=2853432 RepID=UPI001F609A17|nr:hypothetical protein [Allobaculum sp. Allo2]UNT94381.1 hypothetical protein KWG61_07340 [Allobaculum sp. Allo2]